MLTFDILIFALEVATIKRLGWIPQSCYTIRYLESLSLTNYAFFLRKTSLPGGKYLKLLTHFTFIPLSARGIVDVEFPYCNFSNK